MKDYTVEQGIDAPLERANDNTDLIIPNQFLNEILNKYSFPAMACWSCYLNDELFAIIKFDHKKEGVHAEYKYLKHKIEVLKVNFIHFKYDSSCTTWS